MQGESKRLISRDVEEGRTTKSEPGRPQKEKSREWPSKLRMLLFCLILIGSAVILTVVVVSLDQRTGILKTRMSYFSGDPPATSAVFESVFPVKHALSDEELLWRASMVPRRLDMPFSGEKKNCFHVSCRGASASGFDMGEIFRRLREVLFYLYPFTSKPCIRVFQLLCILWAPRS